ncbi:MAG: HlyD family secretion protein [Fusobacteriaceae bacterium]
MYKKKAKLVYLGILLLFIFIFILTISMQLKIPYSSRAFLEYDIFPVYSKLSGNVETIYVKNNEKIKKGQLLFKLNKDILNTEYDSALSNYNKTIDELKILDSDISKTYNILENNTNIYQRDFNDQKKYKLLYDKLYISENEYENIEIKFLQSKKVVEETKKQLNSLLIKRGDITIENPNLIQAKSLLEKARLNLKYSNIYSQISGTLVIDQFHNETYITAGKSLFYIRDDSSMMLKVNIKEKNLQSMTADRKALILFDAIPNKIFTGKMFAVNPILSEGYSEPSSLVSIAPDNRWVRDAGKIRLSIKIDEMSRIENLVSGSKASVILLSNNSFMNFIARCWMSIIKLFNYVY